MASYAQSYGAASPVVSHSSPAPYPTVSPQQAATIQPGSITYTTTTGPDGRVTYHPFKAVPASYQTAQGLVSGIQWIPVEATSVLPANATPAVDLGAPIGRNPDGRSWQRDDDYRRKDDLSRNSVYDRDRRDRFEDDDYYRRGDRDRERDRDDDLRRARDRDGRDPNRRLSSYGGRVPGDFETDKYDKYGDRYDATADIERRMRDVDLDRRDRDRERDRDYERERTARSRRNSVYGAGERPTSTYQAAVGGNYPTSYSGTAYSSTSTYAAAPGGAYPSSPRPGDVIPPRAASPYRVGGALPRPSSPYQAPIAPRPVSPYQPGAVPRAASPFQAAAIQRAASPYGGGGIQRAASPYGGAGIQRAPSPYAAAMQRSASPYAGAAPLPNSSVYSSEPLRPHSRAPSPSPYGQLGAANVYATPQLSSIYGSQPAVYGQAPASYGGSGIGAHASPRMGSTAIDPAQQGMLTVPEGFGRPPNRAQPYTHFDIMKIQDMDELLEAIPRMPAVLVPHDVYHEDWIRLMQDLAMAWAGTLPVPQYDGRPPKRSSLAADVIDLWNASFLKPRGVEMVLYKGRERRSGRLAGTVDMNLPGFDEYDVSSPSDSSDDDDDSAEERHRDRDRYGAYGGVYGRQAEAELREARRARRERKAERKKRKMEKKIRKRAKELERTYAIYLQCVSPLEGM